MDSFDIPRVDERFNTTVQEYIEVIRDLVEDKQVARVKDIAKMRGVTRSSVSTALNMLRDLNLIDHEHYGYAILTEEGKKLGEILRKRHDVILRFLRDILLLDSGLADEEACRLEHAMCNEALNALVLFVETADSCPLRTDRYEKMVSQNRYKHQSFTT